ENGFGDANYLDRSDEFADVLYLNNCFQDPTFRCEKNSCRTNWFHFPGGDEQCVQTLNQCHNGRHLLVIKSMSNQAYSFINCSIAMIYLTQLTIEIYDSNNKIVILYFNFQ
ncbi:unnamed protein product, partial [Rotaria sp. Silwood2]